MEKLSKAKDEQLGRLQKAVSDIKTKVLNEKNSIDDPESEEMLKYFIDKLNKDAGKSDGKMEIMLQRAMQTIQNMTHKNYENKLKMSKMKD